MSSANKSSFMDFLNRHGQDDWWSAVNDLAPLMHEVDRDATKVWFYFWPLWVRNMLQDAEADPQLLEELEFKGVARLEQHIDSSHAFIYGHRHWPQVKIAISERASSQAQFESLDLVDEVRAISSQVAGEIKVDVSLVIGITIIGFMTLYQVGRTSFDTAEGNLHISDWALGRSPQKVHGDRAKNDGGGLLGYLKGLKRDYTVRFDEGLESATFKLIEGVQLTQASMVDQADHLYLNSRCEPGDGPIPTECRSAACGTCWVGILGGNDHLSAVNPLERRRLARFGYIETDEPRPLIRLACKAQATGNVTIVIPTWNAVAGKYLEGKRIAIGGHSSSANEESVVKPRRH